MNWSAKVRFSLRSLFSKRKLDAQLAEEVRTHVEMATEANVKAGMTPEEARYAALREFGNVAGVQERTRDEHGWVWLEQLKQDIKYALRALWKAPGFTVVAAVSLGLGIGANTAVFSLVDSMLLKPPAVRSPDELVRFEWARGPSGGHPRLHDNSLGANSHFSREVFTRLQSEHSLLSGVCAVAGLWTANVSIDNQAEVVAEAELVSGNFHEILGVGAYRGRTLLPEDDRPGALPVCVISHHYWETRFMGAADVIGKTILVNQLQATIVGVTPPGFRGMLVIVAGADITLPIAVAGRIRRDRDMVSKSGYWWLNIIGRHNPGITIQQLEAGLQATFQDAAIADLEKRNERDLPRLTVTAGGRLKSFADDIRKRVVVPLTVMATLALLAACANVANLLLARGSGRRREFAVRMALGASQGRLVRQLITESLLLAVLGAGLGLLISQWNLTLLSAISPKPVAGSGYVSWLNPDRIEMGLPVFVFTVAIALLTSVMVGLVPALRCTRLNLTEEFQGGMHSRGSRALSRLSQFLVVVQVAVSLALLTGAALCARTLHNLNGIDLGFRREQLLLFAIDAQSAGYGPEESVGLVQRIAARLNSMPGVRSVGYSGWPVLTGEGGPNHAEMTIPGGSKDRETVIWNQIGPGFFKTYEMPVMFGRDIGVHDHESGARVAVVNEAFAKRYFGAVNAVGHQVNMRGEREIVGVVRDAKLAVRDLKGPTSPMVFIPFAQSSTAVARFVVRTNLEPESMITSVRKMVGEVDPDLAVMGLSSQAQHVEWRFFHERLFGSVAGIIGLLAAVLASVGLYGLISYAVVRRTAEIGVRMALGAQRRDVIWMVLRESLSIVLVGLVVGIGCTCALMQLAAATFFGIGPTDPATYGAVAFFLTAVSLAACWLPARQAAKVDPVVALRAE